MFFSFEDLYPHLNFYATDVEENNLFTWFDDPMEDNYFDENTYVSESDDFVQTNDEEFQRFDTIKLPLQLFGENIEIRFHVLSTSADVKIDSLKIYRQKNVPCNQ